MRVQLLAFLIVASAAHAQKDVAACKPPSDGMLKTISTPHHAYSTETRQGKNKASEAIMVANKTYVLYDGRWRPSPISVADMMQQEKDNVDSASAYTCRVTKSDVVGGQAATVYRVHYENSIGKFDSDVWVAKATGLVMQNEVDADMGDVGKTHISVKYDYSNVKAPPGV